MTGPWRVGIEGDGLTSVGGFGLSSFWFVAGGFGSGGVEGDSGWLGLGVSGLGWFKLGGFGLGGPGLGGPALGGFALGWLGLDGLG